MGAIWRGSKRPELVAEARRRTSEQLARLGGELRRSRRRRRWTQRQLAEKLWLQMQKIQQYEATGYSGASSTRVAEVARALGAIGEIRLRLIELPDISELSSASQLVSKRR